MRKIKSASQVTLTVGVGLIAIAAVTGCQKSGTETMDKQSFTAAPDYNKLTPEQKKMVAQFSHGKVGGPPPAPSGSH